MRIGPWHGQRGFQCGRVIIQLRAGLLFGIHSVVGCVFIGVCRLHLHNGVLLIQRCCHLHFRFQFLIVFWGSAGGQRALQF